jgi:protoporphyrinogen/coproporphyrinogen III oxidase
VTAHSTALVVGGGVSGLVCAYSLRKAGIDTQLLEASSRPGGVIRSERRDGFLLELGPQSFSGTAPLLELCRGLGIDGQLVQAPPRTPRYVLVGGALRKVPLSPRAFFASSLFSIGTKWTILRDAFGTSHPPEQDESIAAFVRRKFSAELLEKLVGPLVSGIYAGDPEQLSLRGAFPQVHEAEKSAGSIVRGMMRSVKTTKEAPKERPSLLTFREGNETLIRALAASLGDALRCNAEVIAIQRRTKGGAEGYEVCLSAAGRDETLEVDHLIVATPTNAAAELLRQIGAGFESALQGIPYAPVAVVSLGYRKSDVGHPLEGFGFLVPRSSGLEILGSVWNSPLFPNRAPDGKVLLTSFVGGVTNPQAITRSPQELISLVHREIAPVLKIRQEPVFSSVNIYQRAIPQYNLGHGERLASLEALRAKYPGLWLIGNYLRGPAIGACVEQALAVTGEIAKHIPIETRDSSAHGNLPYSSTGDEEA